MHKLLILSFSVLFSIGLYAQQNVYSGSDNKLEYKVNVEQYTDKQNDVFYEYYSLEIKNISNSEVTFKPVFKYKTDQGESRSSLTRDENHMITLKSGETIKGNVNNDEILTLFKQFSIGNSGKKASNVFYTLESISINY
jgi:hypothetical protein